MALERERKFLVKSIPFEFVNQIWTEIWQMYIFANKDRQLRIRMVHHNNDKDRAYITYKEHVNDTDKIEYEYELDYMLAWNIKEKKEYDSILIKKRLSINGWDIDIYTNNLIVAEYEYSDKNTFPETLPDWIGEEITGMSEYSNIVLAKKK